MALEVKKLTNGNLYVNGVSFLGKTEEVTLPTISFKTVEHKALGMHGSIKLPTGVDNIEVKCKWSSITRESHIITANPFVEHSFQLRSSLDAYDSTGRVSQESYVVHFRGKSSDIPNGAFKQHDNVEAESTFNCSYIKLEIAGNVVYEIDVMANIHKVDGVDLLATYRANLGV